jgi:hypothetical protein
MSSSFEDLFMGKTPYKKLAHIPDRQRCSPRGILNTSKPVICSDIDHSQLDNGNRPTIKGGYSDECLYCFSNHNFAVCITFWRSIPPDNALWVRGGALSQPQNGYPNRELESKNEKIDGLAHVRPFLFKNVRPLS